MSRRISKDGVSRRTVLAGAAAGAAVLSFPGIVRAKNQEVVINVPGGIYEQNFRKHVTDPFEAKTGKKIILRYKPASEVLTNMMVQSDAPEYDIAYLSYPVAMKAIKTEGIFEDMPASKVPNAKELDPIFYDLYEQRAAGFNFAPYGLGYNTANVSPAPTSWQDLWREDVAGHITLPDISGGWVFETVALAAIINGGDIENLDPGFEAIKKIKKNVHRFYKSSPESVQLFERSEAWIGGIASSRMYALKDQGLPIDWVAPKEGAPIGVLSFHIAKNTPNKDLAFEFVNFALGKEPQEGFANGIEFGPCNSKAELKGRAKERVPGFDQLMRLDWRKIEPQMGAIAERWQREIVG